MKLSNEIVNKINDKFNLKLKTIESAQMDEFIDSIIKKNDMKKQSKIKMDEFDTIEKIVSQLKRCDYENEAGILNKNIAFLALERMAKSKIVVYKDGSYNIAQHDLEAKEHESVNKDYLTTIVI